MRRAFTNCIGWLSLALLDLPLFLSLHFHPIEPRPGLTPVREYLTQTCVFLMLIAGSCFRLGPVVFWPSFAAVVSVNLVVNGVGVLEHTIALVLVGVVVGIIHDARLRSGKSPISQVR